MVVPLTREADTLIRTEIKWLLATHTGPCTIPANKASRRVRTGNLLITDQLRFPLRQRSMIGAFSSLEGTAGFEPATIRLTAGRSTN